MTVKRGSQQTIISGTQIGSVLINIRNRMCVLHLSGCAVDYLFVAPRVSSGLKHQRPGPLCTWEYADGGLVVPCDCYDG